MQRTFVLAAVAAATLLAAGAANAGGRVDWSIGINLPAVAAVVSGPGYYRAPSYYAPAVYPVETYYPPRVVYAPRPRVWLPPPPPLPRFGFAPGWHRDGWRNDGWRNDGSRDAGWRGHDGRHGDGGRR